MRLAFEVVQHCTEVCAANSDTTEHLTFLDFLTGAVVKVLVMVLVYGLLSWRSGRGY